MSARMLVTGFQPFGGATINPAWEAVRRLPDTIGGAEVVKVEIPVVFGRASAAVDVAIEANGPDIVLCVGQAGGRCKITPEFVGINYIDARIPDNEGNQPLAKRVVEDGPDAYFSTLPVRAMAQAMNDAGVPAAVSFTAGTYVCNDVMYALLHSLATRFPGTRGAFLHVPYASEQATQLPADTPSMPIETMAKGLEVALAAALEHMEDVALSVGTMH